jgi:glyoxylate reductase
MDHDGLPNLVITRKLPETAMQFLDGKAKVDIWKHERPMPRKEFLNRIKGKDGLICLLSDTIDREAMDQGSDLKVIANYAVGYDNIDVDCATEKGIFVLNTPGVLTDATADLAFALILSTSRRISESDRYVRDGKFKYWGPELMLGKDVWKATLGVIGAGKIGRAVLERGKGFSMKLLYNSRTRKPELEEDLGARFVSMDELLEESDFISLNCPLTSQTRHLIGRKEFQKMKDDAILINTARGPVVDEKSLVEALNKGMLAGAGLDVYEYEPRVSDELLGMENVVMAPHIGSATHSTRNKMARMSAEGVMKILSGGLPENIVNKEVAENEDHD